MSTMNIGEFARRTGLSVSAIRFYGDRNLLVATEIDVSSGYRSYSLDQVEDGRIIADLRRMNMPLTQIERVLGSSGHERRAQILEHIERLEIAVHRAHVIAQSFDVQSTSEENPMTNNTTTTTAASTPTNAIGAAANLGARDLGHAIDQVLPSAGRETTMPHLMCVLIESKEGSIRFVTTDSHRLSVRDVVPSSQTAPFVAVVAADAIRAWGTLLDRDGDVTLACDGNVIAVDGDGIELRAAAIPVTFVDYEPILVSAPDRTSAAVVVGRQDLLAAFDGFDTGGAVLVSASKDRLVLQRRGDVIEVAATFDGPEAHVALDPRYGADAVRSAVGLEAVLEIADPLEPVIFRSADDGTFTSLLMPVRLD